MIIPQQLNMKNNLIDSVDEMMNNQKNIIIECMKQMSEANHDNELLLPTVTDDLQMLTADEVATLFNVHKNQISMYRDMGILKGTKTGKNFMYSKSEIMEFQKRFRGYDISNKFKVKEALQAMRLKEVSEYGK